MVIAAAALGVVGDQIIALLGPQATAVTVVVVELYVSVNVPTAFDRPSINC